MIFIHMLKGNSMEDFIVFKDVNKFYEMGKVIIPANKDINFSISKGELVIIVGPSGAGKTTILNILGGMDSPNSGCVFVDNVDITKLNTKEITMYRRFDCGFVFQFYNLVPNLTAKENVELAIEISKSKLEAKALLAMVGLEERMNNFPSQLSGGEQQRVAIARALAKNPKLLLCDEPTGALDYETGKSILHLLQDLCIKNKATVVIVTHNTALIPIGNRVIKVKDNRINEVIINPKPKLIDEVEW